LKSHLITFRLNYYVQHLWQVFESKHDARVLSYSILVFLQHTYLLGGSWM
jgi:hypothetical protein